MKLAINAFLSFCGMASCCREYMLGDVLSNALLISIVTSDVWEKGCGWVKPSRSCVVL